MGHPTDPSHQTISRQTKCHVLFNRNETLDTSLNFDGIRVNRDSLADETPKSHLDGSEVRVVGYEKCHRYGRISGYRTWPRSQPDTAHINFKCLAGTRAWLYASLALPCAIPGHNHLLYTYDPHISIVTLGQRILSVTNIPTFWHSQTSAFVGDLNNFDSTLIKYFSLSQVPTHDRRCCHGNQDLVLEQTSISPCLLTSKPNYSVRIFNKLSQAGFEIIISWAHKFNFRLG